MFNAFEISNIEKDNLKKALEDVDGIIIRSAPNLTSDILEDCRKIKIIARHGVGYDNVDLEYLNQNNIALGVEENEIDIDLLDRCIKMSELDKFISNLPQGIDTIVGERGARISGGGTAPESASLWTSSAPSTSASAPASASSFLCFLLPGFLTMGAGHKGQHSERTIFLANLHCHMAPHAYPQSMS